MPYHADMTEPSTHAAIVISSDALSAQQLTALKGLTGLGLADIKSRARDAQALVVVPLFDNAFFDTNGSMLRQLIEFLDGSGLEFRVYELGSADMSEARDETDLISGAILKNMIDAAMSGPDRA